jgi:hypothetical protein
MPHNARECAAILLDVIDPHHDVRESYTYDGHEEATRNARATCTYLLNSVVVKRLQQEFGIGLWELYYHGFLAGSPPVKEERERMLQAGEELPAQYLRLDRVLEYAEKYERLDAEGLIR